MRYLAIVAVVNNRIAKYRDFDTEAEADAHALEHGGFVVAEPKGFYNLEFLVVDSIAKTVTYDSDSYTAYSDMKTWKREMQELDSSAGGTPAMTREMEEHITDEHGGVVSNPAKQAKYDAKILKRSQKP